MPGEYACNLDVKGGEANKMRVIPGVRFARPFNAFSEMALLVCWDWLPRGFARLLAQLLFVHSHVHSSLHSLCLVRVRRYV